MKGRMVVRIQFSSLAPLRGQPTPKGKSYSTEMEMRRYQDRSKFRKLLIIGGLMLGVSLSSACSSQDPLLRELRESSLDRITVSLRDVYGQEWQNFALVCPSVPAAVISSELGIPSDRLPDYSGTDHLNALVRWNSEHLEVSEFPVAQLRLCTSESPWSPKISDPIVVFKRSSGGGFILQ